jgi:hypothetical protein
MFSSFSMTQALEGITAYQRKPRGSRHILAMLPVCPTLLMLSTSCAGVPGFSASLACHVRDFSFHLKVALLDAAGRQLAEVKLRTHYHPFVLI